MPEQNANFPHLHLISSYLVFGLENDTLVCKGSFTTQKGAFKATASIGGFVVDAFQVERIREKNTFPEKEKVHELRLGE